MTELNHFADPNIPFSAPYGTDGPRLTEDSRQAVLEPIQVRLRSDVPVQEGAAARLGHVRP